MKSDTSEVFIRTEIFGFIVNDTTIDEKNFKRAEIPEEPLQQIHNETTIVGRPKMPYIKLLIAVPDSCEFNISVYPSDYATFDNYLMYPVPRTVFKTDTFDCFYSKEVYAYDTTFYQKDTIYPDKFYEVNSEGHWRDQRVLEVYLYPVQCNPYEKEMYFYENISLRIEYTGKVVENRHGLGPFEDIGREILLNYPGIYKEQGTRPPASVHYYTKLKDTTNLADYIIVTHRDFLQNKTTRRWIDSLAQWRVDHNKFDVGIVKIRDVYDEFPGSAPDSAAQLRDFLVYAYDNWKALSMPDSHFAYCLFIGDWDYVPMKALFYFYGDSCYPPGTNPGSSWLNAYEGYFRDIDDTCLNHNDDIMLGRLPVKWNYVNQLVAILSKTINYEKYPDTTAWRRRGLLIAGGDAGYTVPEVLEATSFFTDIGYDTFRVIWDSIQNDSVYKWKIHGSFNSGENITAYYGHSGPNGWPGYFWNSWPCPDSLKNGDSLPVIFSYSCNPAMFQREHPYYDTLVPPGTPNYWNHDTVYAEHFLYNSNGGAVAFYGPTSPVDMGFYNVNAMKEILRNQQWILGKALVNNEYNGEWNCYCILGDPALDLGDYTAYPNLPDIVMRPIPAIDNKDISIMTPHPYHTSGDIIPIRARVYNIGGAAASNVEVKFDVLKSLSDTAYSNTVVIPEIQPRDTAIAITEWNTSVTHPGVYGIIGNTIWVKADPDSEITESWEYNNRSSKSEKIVLYPNESGWPKKVMPSVETSQPAITDLDETGNAEIVYGSVDSLYVFKNNGSNLEGWPQYFCGICGIVVGDLDCMGNPEIVAISQDSVKAYDYQGTVIWRQELPDTLPDYLSGLPAMGYVSGADKREVAIFNLAKFTTPKVLVYGYNGNLLRVLSASDTANGNSWSWGPAISDVNGDGFEEIVLSYATYPDNPARANYYGTDLFNITSNVAVDTLANIGNSHSIPALVDLDDPADGYAELITSRYNTNITAYKPRNKTTLWQTETYGAIKSSPAAGDINPLFDGNEIAFGNDTSRIYAIRGYYGDPIFPYPLFTCTKVRISPALARLEGPLDENVDIVIAANDWNVVALNYQGTDTIYPYPLPLFHSLSSPVIGDIDGDGRSETILATSEGYLHVWENVNSGVQRKLLEWPQFHHDYQRTGLYNWLSGFSGGDAKPRVFSTATTISFSLKDTFDTQVRIFDTQGNVVKNFVNQILPKGSYHPVWDGKNNNNVLLPNGLYFIEFKIRNERKVIPVRIRR